MRDRDGDAWFVGWLLGSFAWIALAAALTCCAHRPPRSQAAEPAPRTITVTLRCLTQAPPEPPRYDSDPAIARAQQEQAYDALALWAYLYAWPSCRE